MWGAVIVIAVVAYLAYQYWLNHRPAWRLEMEVDDLRRHAARLDELAVRKRRQ